MGAATYNHTALASWNERVFSNMLFHVEQAKKHGVDFFAQSGNAIGNRDGDDNKSGLSSDDASATMLPPPDEDPM